MNTSTFRYSGLVHTKSIGVVPSVDKKGVIFVYKKAKKAVSNSMVCDTLRKRFHDDLLFWIKGWPRPLSTRLNTFRPLLTRFQHDSKLTKLFFICRTNQRKAPGASSSRRDRNALWRRSRTSSRPRSTDPTSSKLLFAARAPFTDRRRRSQPRRAKSQPRRSPNKLKRARFVFTRNFFNKTNIQRIETKNDCEVFFIYCPDRGFIWFQNLKLNILIKFDFI